MRKLRLFWPEPQVVFNGKGITTAWKEEMALQGWELTGKREEADLIFLGSNSVLRPEDYESGKPTICYFWGWPPMRTLDPEYKEGIQTALTMMSKCTRILVPGPVTQDHLACYGLYGHICVPGVDLRLIDSVPPGENTGPRIIFISRLASYKGLGTLIQALSLITPSLKLIVCGPGDKTPYMELAAQLNVDAAFMEPTDQEKIALLKSSSLLVHPSLYEGFGLPPLEAIACNVPVIAANIPQMKWLFGDDALFFDGPEELAEKIAFAFTDYNKMKELTAYGNERVRRLLTLEKACERLWPHIHQTIKEHLGREIRQKPEDTGKIYDIEHTRNWNYSVERFDPTWARHWRAQSFIGALEECGAKNILDIGAGAVYPTIFARAGFHVSAVDISMECILQIEDIARKWDVAGMVRTFVADANSLPFPDNIYDAVVQGEIWEHLEDPRKVIAEGLRVLKPGGYLIASTPIGEHHYDPMHIKIFDDDSIRELVAPFPVKRIEKIAEASGEPSCYLIIMEKPA